MKLNHAVLVDFDTHLLNILGPEGDDENQDLQEELHRHDHRNIQGRNRHRRTRGRVYVKDSV